MNDTVIPYELPETEDHSFFFVSQRIRTDLEAKLHRHDAWELYCVVEGHGNRIAGDTMLPFKTNDVVLIPPSMLHQWIYDWVLRCINIFPELRNRLSGTVFPAEALKFGAKSAAVIHKALAEMSGKDEWGRVCGLLRLLPFVFTTSDHMFAGKPMRMDRDVRRMQQVSEYIMAHYSRRITLNDIAAETGMNRSAFCIWFNRYKGMSFSRFLAQYRLRTACELLKHSQKSVSEIGYIVGFNDIPHFVRVFTKEMGVSPGKYRKRPMADDDE